MLVTGRNTSALLLWACLLLGGPDALAQAAGVTVNLGGSVSVDETGPTTDTYTVVLDSAPTAPVSITATADGQIEVSSDNVSFSSSITLSFDGTNWNTPQVVYVRTVDDLVAEASPHTGTITHSAVSADGSYNGIAIASVAANVTDNDAAGVVIDTGGGVAVDETGPTTDTYTVVLTSEPSAPTTITVTAADGQTRVSSNGVTFGGSAALTFTSGDWSIPKTVTVRAFDDQVDEAVPHFGTIVHSASGAAEYVALNPLASVTASITDDDTAGVTITESGGATDVAEGGATDSYTVVLNTQPTANVTIGFNTGSQLQAIADVTFTTANWNMSRTITVTAMNDGFVEGPHIGAITHAATSTDGNYNGIPVPDVTANITDNDSFAVIVTQSGGTTSVSEGGATDTYTLLLGSQPIADVTISFNTGSQLQAIADVTFTMGNWNTPRTITVTAIDDGSVEGLHTGTIAHTATSTDGNYNGVPVASVVANITDNDSFAVIVTQSGGSTSVSEGGPTDTYTLVLGSQPAADVTISFNPDPQLQAIAPITFTMGNWNVPRTVTVTAVDDAAAEGSHTGAITHAATSTDGNYNGIPIASVVANITDNDTAGVTITESGGTTNVSEGGATDTYTIVLDTLPTTSVTISFVTGSQLQAISPITFTTSDWNTPRILTVAAVNDLLAEGPHTGTITHAATSGDPNHDGILIASVVANIADNDGAGVTITGAGPGGGPHVRVLRWVGGTPQEQASFHAYDGGFTGGVFVAAGNVVGDDQTEVITGSGAGGGPHVRAFTGTGADTGISGYAYDPAFTGGVRVASCDVDGDGRADVLAAAGPGGGPHVRVVKADVVGGLVGDLASFYAYDPAFAGGVFVTCGDVDGDGMPDVITGAGPGGGPHVRVLKWLGGGAFQELASLMAFDPAFQGGVRVAAGNVDGSDRASIIVGAGPGGSPHVRVLKWLGGAVQELASFYAYDPAFTGGVFVAAGNVTGDGQAEVITGAGAGGSPHVRVFTGTGADTGIGFYVYDPGFAGGVAVAGAAP